MPRVVVVGAGIAGLAAAWDLQRAGVEVVVLERESVVGGRMRSEQWGETWMDLGAGETSVDSGAMTELARELNVKVIPHHGNEHLTTRVYRDGRIHEVDATNPLSYLKYGGMSWLGRAKMTRILPAFARYLWMTRGRQSTIADAVWADHESIDSWLSRVAPEFLEYAAEPMLGGQATWSPSDVSKGFFLHLFTTHGNIELVTFEEGLGQLPRAMAEHIDVRCGATVTDLRPTEAPVVVEFTHEGENRELDADYVVVAVPGSRVLDIVSGLGSSRERFFRQVSYVPAEYLSLRMPEPPAGLEGMVHFPRREDRELARAGWHERSEEHTSELQSH